MITIAMTAYKEPSILSTIDGIMKQNLENFELIIATPNTILADEVKNLKSSKIKLIFEEKREGKPAAINKILKKAKGEIIVFTDADVKIETGAINKILRHFKDKNVGLVSARLVPTNTKDTKYGFWADLLYDQAHRIRSENPFFASGNLFAIKNVIKKIPKDSLVDDFVIAKKIQRKNYNAIYEKNAKVHVKFPSNTKDFLKQRVRTFAGYLQIKKWFGTKERSALSELRKMSVFSYCKRPIHYIWLTELAILRFWARFLAFWDLKVKKKKIEEIWTPVSSTK